MFYDIALPIPETIKQSGQPRFGFASHAAEESPAASNTGLGVIAFTRVHAGYVRFIEQQVSDFSGLYARKKKPQRYSVGIALHLDLGG